ncbi:hypothetical protein, partial [Klebsiella pneumoniae]|uniref:hypothetical protein n=1 Tax=Klebsiella pneumoniae TaxID=573 RepID=UPI003852EB44
EKDIEDKKREQRNLEGEITQSEEQQKQLIAQKASLNIDNQVLLLKKDIQQETEKMDFKKQSASDYIKLAAKLELQS